MLIFQGLYPGSKHPSPVKTFEAKPLKNVGHNEISLVEKWEKRGGGVPLEKHKHKRGKPISFKNNLCKKSENVFFCKSIQLEILKNYTYETFGCSKIVGFCPIKKNPVARGVPRFFQGKTSESTHHNIPASWISWITIGQS